MSEHVLPHVSILPFPIGSTSVRTCLAPCLYTALSHWFHVCQNMFCPMSLYCPFPLVPRLSEHVLSHVSILPFPIGSTSVRPCLAPCLFCPFPLVPHLSDHVLPHVSSALSRWFHVCQTMPCPMSLLPFPIGSTSVRPCLAPCLFCPFPLVPHLSDHVLPHVSSALSHWFHICQTMSCPMSLLPFPIGSTSVRPCLAPCLFCPFPLVPHLSDHLTPVLSLCCSTPLVPHLLEHVSVVPSCTVFAVIKHFKITY